MAQNVLQSLSEDFVKCTICVEPYKDPKMLPCLHSFCLQCLEGWAVNCYDKLLSCPTCRSTVDLPSNGVNGLPHNFFLVSLMERLKEMNRLSNENQDYECNICKNKKDVLFCLDCKMHVCRGCKKTHDRFTRSSDHPLIPSDKLSDEKYLKELLSTQAPYCTNHNTEKLRYFCTQCSKLVCQVCTIVSHQGHQSLQEVESRVISVKSKLKALLGKGETLMSGELEKLKRTMKSAEEIKSEISELGAQIDAQYEEFVAKLQSDKKELKEKLRGIENERSSTLKHTETKISNWLRAMKNTNETTRRILEQNNSWEILEMEKKIADAMAKLQKDTEMVSVSSIPPQVDLEFCPAKLAKLNPGKDKAPRRNEPQENFLGEFVEKKLGLLDFLNSL